MLEKLRSLLERAGISFSSSSKSLEIRDGKLTVTRNGFSRTFDVTSGISDTLSAELTRMGLSAADLQALVHLSHAAIGSSQQVTWTAQQNRRITSVNTLEKSPDMLSLSTPVSPDGVQPPPESGNVQHISQLTIEVNGQQRTYDTTSGVSEELRHQLAQQMGVSVSELATLLKLPGTAEQALPASDFRPASGARQTVACPRCGHQVVMAQRCVYCGEPLASQTPAAGNVP